VAKGRSRRYGVPHKKRRQRVAREVAAGTAVCVRCGTLIVPRSEWDLDQRTGVTVGLGLRMLGVTGRWVADWAVAGSLGARSCSWVASRAGAGRSVGAGRCGIRVVRGTLTSAVRSGGPTAI
jgi:hypothetical protein